MEDTEPKPIQPNYPQDASYRPYATRQKQVERQCRQPVQDRDGRQHEDQESEYGMATSNSLTSRLPVSSIKIARTSVKS